MFSTRGMPMRISERFFISSTRFLGGRGEDNLRQRIGHDRRVRHTEDRLGRFLDKVGVGLLDLIQSPLALARHTEHRFRRYLDKVAIYLLDLIQTPLDLAHAVPALDSTLLARVPVDSVVAGAPWRVAPRH